MSGKGLVFGVGKNDVDYVVQKKVNYKDKDGKTKQKLLWACPYYVKWKAMLGRCYYGTNLDRNPTYIGCYVCTEWLYLSNFIKWVDEQPNREWQQCRPDKDILVVSNKIYCPNTVVFVEDWVNKFVSDSAKTRGDCLLGVSFHKRDSKFQANCNNPFTKRMEYLGYFLDELEAHKAWQGKKHEYACQIADLQDDPRVADALRQRYSTDKDWTKA